MIETSKELLKFIYKISDKMGENTREEVKLEGYVLIKEEIPIKEETPLSSVDTYTVYLKEEDVKTEISEIKGQELR